MIAQRSALFLSSVEISMVRPYLPNQKKVLRPVDQVEDRRNSL